MKHILIVDDHPGIRLLLEEIFKLEGYNVTTASSGKETLKLLESHHFEFLIIDQHLPDIKGIQIINTMATKPNIIPVILISGLTTNLHTFKEQHAFIKAVIEKPFNVKVLLEIINDTL